MINSVVQMINLVMQMSITVVQLLIKKIRAGLYVRLSLFLMLIIKSALFVIRKG